VNRIDQQDLVREFRASRPIDAPPTEIGIGELLRKVWSRRWFLVGVVAAFMLLAGIITFLLTPLYSSDASILIGNRDTTLGDLQAAVSSIPTEAESVQSEVAVLKSTGLAGKVVDALNLTQDPEFNLALREPTLVQDIRAYIKAGVDVVKNWLGIPLPPALTEEQKRQQEFVETVEAFQQNLLVTSSTGSWVINIDFTSASPQRAAQVANTLTDMYITDQLDAKYEATRKGADWLAGKIAELRRNVLDAEKAVEAFRSKSGLLSGTRGTLIEQQISDLNTQLIVARTSRSELESRLAQIQRMARSTAGAQAAADVLQSPIILELSNQETIAKRSVAELAQELGDRHPKIISTRAALADIQAKIAVEIRKVASGIESELSVARGREQRLDSALQQLKSNLAQSNTADVQLRALEREVDANRSILEAFLARSEQLRSQMDSGAFQPDARIISKAVIPVEPSFPPVKIFLAIALVLATVIGLFLLFVVEQLERGFRDSSQVQQTTGVRTLTLVPRIEQRSQRKSPAALIVDQPGSMFSESIRSLSTRLLISSADTPLKRILVSSSLPNEGKTTVAASLARARAIAGHKTVLIEGDLRRPSMHRIFGNPRDPGLADIVLGKASLAQALYKDDASGVYVVPAGRAVSDPSAIFGSPRLRALLDALGKEFDSIIIDSPPLMVATDALVLSVEADFTVFVIRWGKTTRDVAALALSRLNETRRGPVAAVLSMVNPRRQAQYSGGDAGYFYKDVRKYYTR
jgi:polysaccharide biosynthesis transport protein